MSELLSNIYFGKLKPCTSKEWYTEELEFHRKHYLEQEKKLMDLLSPEAKGIFLKYTEHNDRVLAIHCEMNFKEGFVLGGKIFAEVLTQKENTD